MKPLHHVSTPANAPFDTSHLNKGLSELTPREWEIFLHIADDLTTAEIADQLCLTEKSVENYHTRIGHKLYLTGAHKLARFARRHVAELRQWHEQKLGELPPK